MSADTIVPGYTNPQNLNRYSYVNNNPLRYIDPTGHMRLENDGGGGCSISGYCGPSNNNNNQNNDDDDDDHDSGGGEGDEDESLKYSTTITIGLSLGNPLAVQDYYSDYENNTNVPYFSGGNTQPNPCTGTAPAFLCLANFFVSVFPPASGPTNPANNFFLSFNLTYTPGIDTTISGLQWSNTYQGDAVFNYLTINDTGVYGENSYILHDGSSNPIGGTYTSNMEMEISGKVSTLINTPNGPGLWPYPFTYTVPDLP